MYSPMSISPAVCKVLDNDDLVVEILLRVGFPATLVRAALVCKHWFHHVSDHAFLHRFRKLHPPRLLGFYVNPEKVGEHPRFIPMLPQLPELASVVRRASSSLESYQSNGTWNRMIHCRNGTALMEQHATGSQSTLRVHNLLTPEGDMLVVPKLPFPEFIYHCDVLSKEEGGRVSYFFVSEQFKMVNKPKVLIYRLQDGVWSMDNLALEHLPRLWHRPKSVLVANKIYMATRWDGIIVMDLIASSFYTIRLPHGVEHGYANTILARADDVASVYLIHVEQLLLRIWLYNTDDWVLVGSICLHEMCASLNISDCNATLRMNQVGDNADFVFMEMGQWILYLDIKCRTLHKVYEMTNLDPLKEFGDIYPFMMIWPPTFPTLKCDDHARFASYTLDGRYIQFSC